MKGEALIGKHSKTKGAGYENKVAKMLTEWWGDGKFSRVPASGGLHWANDQRVAGDIVPPPNSSFPFVVELKKREGWTMEHILLNIGEPKTWWEQVVQDARRVQKVPFLMFSRNRAKDFVMIPYHHDFYELLTAKNQDSMITDVSFLNIREEKQLFEVIVTTYEALTSLEIEEIESYALDALDVWDDYNI